MNSKTFRQKLAIVMMFAMLAESCRPPTLTEDAMDRSTSRMGEQDVYPRHTGQSPPMIQLEYNLDPRPNYIRATDNPDYDRTAGAFDKMWNAVFERLSSKDRPVETRPDLKTESDVAHFPPPPKDDHIDAYDFHSGRVTVDPTVGMDSDLDVQEMRKRQITFEEEMKTKSLLKEQRDYLEGKAKDDVARFNQRKIEGFSKELLKQIDDLKGEIDASIVEHNIAVDQMIHDDVKVTEIQGPNGYEFKTSTNTISGQKVRSAQYAINSAQKSVSQLTGTARERGEAMLGVAQNAVIVGDNAYATGDQATGDYWMEIATTAVDVGLSLIPVVGLGKDIVEASTGYSIVTGKKLSKFERTMAVVGILTAGYGSGILKLAGKAATAADVFKAGKVAEEAAEIARATMKAEKIAASATEVGIKEKAVLDEIASAVKSKLPCVAKHLPRSPFRILLSLFEGTAYASDCFLGEAEEALESALAAAKDAKINLRDVDAARLKDNPLNGTQYTEKVLGQKKSDVYHGFSDYIDNFAGVGRKSEIIGGDGVKRMKVELDGGWVGKNGHFEWIIEPNRTVNHRIFVPKR